MQVSSFHGLPRTTCGTRRGATLVIVLALLGLLAFTAMVFYSFASQERAAAESFSEAAKYVVERPDEVFDHMLRHVIVGPSDSPAESHSILASATRRHSLITNLVGDDLHPQTGEGVRVDVDEDGVAFVEPSTDWLEFVDSPAARAHAGYASRGLEARRIPSPPTPDVDYTYPDINNLFLAWRGTALRDNGAGSAPRYEQVPVIIPSYFRPQYLKSRRINGPRGSNVPTDSDWAERLAGNRISTPLPARSFRPHPLHIAGRLSDGSVVYRYIGSEESRIRGVSGGFPFLPEDDRNNPSNDPAVQGELGIWTGSHPSVFELDADNDGDGVKEGIWLDLHFPIQQTSDGREYAVLHSVTIYDLDSLIDLNAHGNLSGLHRGDTLASPAPPAIRDGFMHTQFISRSNLGLGPNEINPLWALRRSADADQWELPEYAETRQQFLRHFGRLPATDIEQANFEWIWLLGGRVDFAAGSSGMDNIFTGRWGEADRVYRTWRPGGPRAVWSLPRPGRSGETVDRLLDAGIRFGGEEFAMTLSNPQDRRGYSGFDDNNDSLQDAWPRVGPGNHFIYTLGWERSHPMDYSGAGRSSEGAAGNYDGRMFTEITGSPRNAMLNSFGLQYRGYNFSRDEDFLFRRRYGWSDWYRGDPKWHLMLAPVFDGLFEDPLETVIDQDQARRPIDDIFSTNELYSLHLSPADFSKAIGVSRRPVRLAPFALEISLNNRIRERFTTLTGSLRHFPIQEDLGPDRKLDTADDGPRAWEFSANTSPHAADGESQGGEFPPAFGKTPSTGLPYSRTDPFRPEVRRLLTVRAGAKHKPLGQLPLSINHLLDMDHTSATPESLNSPAQLSRFIQNAALRMRPFTLHVHPDYFEKTPNADKRPRQISDVTEIPRFDPQKPVPFPPVTMAEQEFWARRDRQQFCRDVFVLLYTLAGTQRNPASPTRIADYARLPNDPAAAEGWIDPSGTSGSCLYSAAQLREMAQFAVNLVDAMDTDNIVTKFEYDKNLGPDLHGLKKGGWNLDDDPFTMEEAPVSESDPRFAVLTDNGRYREDGLTRGVVYGVESRRCITEVLAVNALPSPDQKDHQLTLHDDSKGRKLLFVELSDGGDYNFEIENAGSVYRLARFDRAHRSHPCGGLGNNGRPFRTLCLDNGRDDVGILIDVVSFASDTSVVNSQLYVDVNDDGQYECIAPWRTEADGPLPTTTTDPQDTEVRSLKCSSSYDVIREWVDGRIPLIEDQFGNPMQRPEAFLDDLRPYRGNEPQHKLRGGDYPDTGLTGFDLALQRRLNPYAINLPHGDVPGEDPNPWVTIDIFRVEFRDLEVHSTDTPQILQSLRLPRITSDERSVACDASSRAPWTGSAPAESRYNSIGFGNLSAATRGDHDTFLQHFDRPWANFAEIFSVPLCGPENLTTVFQRLNQSPVNQTRAPDADKLWPGFAASAAARFLLPDFPDDPELSLVQNQARDNAWYRLLQFFEVPSRVNQMQGNPVTMQKLPGKLNLNTIRHWEVFAGLVDNPLILDRTPEADPKNGINPQGFITQDRTLDEHGKIPAVRRDRWLEYLIERDGGFIPGYDPRDTVNAHCKLLIPGSPTAVPFRSLAHRSTARFNQPANHGIDQTLLRTLTADRVDHDPLTNRHWLELGNAEQHKSNVTSTAMHLHQVLGKMFTNTTTTSNTFIVFATAAYFEAVEHKLPNGEGSGLHRIGARININPAKPRTENENPGWSQRAVFVIDRSEVLQAYDSNLGEFDWRKLVKSRLVLE